MTLLLWLLYSNQSVGRHSHSWTIILLGPFDSFNYIVDLHYIFRLNRNSIIYICFTIIIIIIIIIIIVYVWILRWDWHRNSSTTYVLRWFPRRPSQFDAVRSGGEAGRPRAMSAQWLPHDVGSVWLVEGQLRLVANTTAEMCYTCVILSADTVFIVSVMPSTRRYACNTKTWRCVCNQSRSMLTWWADDLSRLFNGKYSLTVFVLQCSVSCGGRGLRSRRLHCIWVSNKQVADSQHCEHLPSRPPTSKSCFAPPCMDAGTCSAKRLV